MNAFMKEFSQHKVIVVCRGIPEEDMVQVAQALYDGGIRFMEVPFNQADPASFVSTARKIQAVKAALGDKLHVGAGTVITMEQFELARQAGAELIVSPTMEEDIITATKAAGLISVPGCATPSEMTKAYKLGADLIKLFPASIVNLKVIKEIRVPLNHLPLVCFGGVNTENLREVLATGVVGVGMASSILNKQALENKDFAKITALAKAVTQQI